MAGKNDSNVTPQLKLAESNYNAGDRGTVKGSVIGKKQGRGVILTMQKDLFDHGYQRAVTSGALEASGADERALEEHAKAMAREAYRDAFDPTKHAHDEMLNEEYRKNVNERAQLE